jgi:hypothetical protein
MLQPSLGGTPLETLLVKVQFMSSFDTPSNSLIDSIISPKVKTMKG